MPHRSQALSAGDWSQEWSHPSSGPYRRPGRAVKAGLPEVLAQGPGRLGVVGAGKSGREGSVRKHARNLRDVCNRYHLPQEDGECCGGVRQGHRPNPTVPGEVLWCRTPYQGRDPVATARCARW